jgi:hypothetical protein
VRTAVGAVLDQSSGQHRKDEIRRIRYKIGLGDSMGFPIKVCVVCSEEFELKPDKPGFANRCPECSAPEEAEPAAKNSMDAIERKTVAEANEARRRAMRELLYRKDS